jgi:hypothetical protein
MALPTGVSSPVLIPAIVSRAKYGGPGCPNARYGVGGREEILPSTIYDLPFLNEKARRSILGGNAMRVFNIDLPEKIAWVA